MYLKLIYYIEKTHGNKEIFVWLIWNISTLILWKYPLSFFYKPVYSPTHRFTDLDTVVEIKDWQNAILWSKTTQTTGGVDRIWEDPPTCKMGTFFLMSLTLTEPSLNNFQLNRASWQTIKWRFFVYGPISKFNVIFESYGLETITN